MMFLVRYKSRSHTECHSQDGKLFSVRPGLITGVYDVLPLHRPRLGVDRKQFITEHSFAFVSDDGRQWLYKAHVYASAFFPDTLSDCIRVEKFWDRLPRVGPVLAPIAQTANHISVVPGERPFPASTYWTMRLMCPPGSSGLRMQLGAHGDADKLFSPLGIWEYTLPFERFWWLPASRITSDSLTPQTETYSSIIQTSTYEESKQMHEERGTGPCPISVSDPDSVSGR